MIIRTLSWCASKLYMITLLFFNRFYTILIDPRLLDSGQTFTTVTDERGQSEALTEDVGRGVMRLEATRGAKVARPLEVMWLCDSCNCTPEPESVQLQLSP